MTSLRDRATQVRASSGMNALLGLWLMASPLIYPFAPSSIASTWNNVAVGALITLFAAIRVSSPYRNSGLSWFNLILGAWTAMSSWVFGYLSGAQMWNSLVVGLVVIALAVCSGTATGAQHKHVHA